MDEWPICNECKRKVWRTIKGKCEECLGIVSPMFPHIEPEIYTDNLTGVRLEVERDIPEHPKLTLFWTEDSDSLDEINAAIKRLLAQAGANEFS